MMVTPRAELVVAALVAAGPLGGCGGPGIDPRTLVESGSGSYMDDEQRAYVDAVITDFERDPCAAAERLRTRDIALGPSLDVQLLQAYTVARSLCTLGVTSFEVGSDQLGRLSFTQAEESELWTEQGVLLSGDFTDTLVDLREGTPRCGAAWSSEPINVAVLEESSLFVEAPDESFRLLWVQPGAAMNCADTSDLVAGVDLDAGQLAQLYVMRDEAPEDGAALSLQAGMVGGAFVRFNGSTIERSFLSRQPARDTPDDVNYCSGYILDTPTLTVDFGTTAGSVEIDVTSDGDSVLYITDEFGQFIDCNDDGPYGLDSYTILDAPAGRMFIYVGAYSQRQTIEGTVAIRRY